MTGDDPRATAFLESEVDADPFAQFERWFEEARSDGIELAEAMTLATASADGAPSARMVLLKDHGRDGFVFFTGYLSRKGQELAENPRAALVFYWHELGRQVRVEGRVEKVERDESEAYFRSRPLGSRLAVRASEQGKVVPDRGTLDERFDEAAARFGDDVPLPDRWGGYRLRPVVFEFWQHRPNRLHDRLRYRLDGEGWVLERLAP